MDVGVRELKQHLSAYLERVARGEHIRVTHHGRPTAMLVPAQDTAAIERGVREGWLRPGEARPVVALPRARARRRALELLREDRDGR